MALVCKKCLDFDSAVLSDDGTVKSQKFDMENEEQGSHGHLTILLLHRDISNY